MCAENWMLRRLGRLFIHRSMREGVHMAYPPKQKQVLASRLTVLQQHAKCYVNLSVSSNFENDGLCTVFPLRKFHTVQMFPLMRMQLRNHVDQCLSTGCIVHPRVYQNFLGVYHCDGLYRGVPGVCS